MKIRSMILSAMFAALTAVSAFVRIPLPSPLPMITLQVMVVILAGLILPPLYAFFSQLIYLLIGLAGIPVFSEGGGLQYFLKPTFGFLVGFMFAAAGIAMIIRAFPRKKSFWVYPFASVAGIFIIYLIGVPYGYFILNRVLGAGLTINQVLTAFCAIYLPIDLAKAFLASFLSYAVAKRIR